MSDPIERQDAIDAVYKCTDIFINNLPVMVDKADAYKALANLPSAQPERKTGKWTEFDSDEERYDVIKCPYCKHTFTVDSYHWTDIGFVKDDFKFCPNCGADMRGEPDEKT